MLAEIQSVFNVNNWLVHDRFIIASRSDLAQFKFIWNWWHLKNCCVVKCSWQQGKLMMIIRIYDQQHFITTVVITRMTAMTLMTMDIMRMRTVIMISNVMTLWFSYRMVSLNCKGIQQFSSPSHIHHITAMATAGRSYFLTIIIRAPAALQRSADFSSGTNCL